MNIIRDSEYKILDWNISLVSNRIYYEFQKDFAKTVTLKSIFFLDDSSGIMLFSDFPKDKSSLYYFNISTRNKTLFKFILNLTSNQTNICLETNLR